MYQAPRWIAECKCFISFGSRFRLRTRNPINRMRRPGGDPADLPRSDLEHRIVAETNQVGEQGHKETPDPLPGRGRPLRAVSELFRLLQVANVILDRGWARYEMTSG